MDQSRQKSYTVVRRRELEFEVDESISYENVSVEILDWQVKRLRNKEIASVKVLWINHLF